MSDLQVMLRIRADGSGASATLRNAKGEVVELGQEATRTGARMQTGLRQGEDAAKALSAEFDRLRRSVIGAAVIGTTTALVANFAREIVNAGNAFNGFNAGLTAATGSQRAAAQEMQFVRAEAQRLGLDLQSAAKAYTGITAAARGTALEGQAARDIFRGVAEAARVGNLSAAEMAGALTAIQQIMSKGVVSAEELRGQLGERLPGAFRVAALAMGVTEAELSKMLETGSLTADEFLPKFAAGLRDAAAAGLQLSASSPAADFERLGNAIGELANAIAQAGVLDALAAGARDLTKEINALVASGALPTLVSTLGTLAKLGVAAVIFRIAEAARAAGAAKAVQIKQTLAAVAAERAQLAASAQSAAAQVADIQATLRAVEAARAEEVAKLRAAQSDIAKAQATIAATNAVGAQSAALRANRIATEELAAAKARLTAATTALATLGAQQARLTAAETVAIGTQTAAQTALAGAATRTGAAVGMLKTAGAGLVALLGGPWVAGLLGVYGAYLAVNAATEDAEEFLDRLSVRLQQGRDSWSAYTAAMNESRAAYRAANPEIIQRELERNNVLLAQAQERADEGGASAALYADKVRILSDRQRELTAELEKANPALAEQAKSLVASQDAIDKVIAGAQERVTQLRRQIAETQGGLRGGLLFDLQELSRTGIAGSADATREQRDAIRELLADMQRLEAKLKAARSATRGSNDESREAARVARTWAESDRELANAKRPLWEAIQREQEARYQLADMLRDADRDLDNEIALAGLTGRARAELANEISAENFARQVNLASIQAGRPLAAEEIEFIRRNTEARLNARDAIEEATAAQERANAELARFADSYLSQATDAIGEFVAGGMRDWKDMWDSFKDIAKRAVADIVSQLLRQKIVVPIVAQLTGQGGAGGALGGIGNILGGLGSIFGGGAGGAAAGGGLGGILGGIGGLFGLGGGAFAGATAAGAAGVAGGAFSGAVASGTVGLGGALGGIASALGPIGLAIGAISLLRNVFGSNKPPDIRLGAVGQTRKPEVTFGTDLGQFQAGVRGGPDRDSIVRAVTEFDRGIAQIIGSIQGGSDQLNVIRDRLASWSVDLRGSAATAENVLGSRWQAILSTFPEDIQAIVRSAGDLQAQVQALGQVLAMPAQVQGILGDLRREFDLAGMSELERQTFLVNERFDALREQLTALRATQEQLAEVETFRTQALAALTSATDGAGNAIEDLTDQIRAYADFVAGFQAEAATAGLNEFQRELVGIQARLRENITRANELARAAGLQGAREEDLALIHQLAAQSAASAMSQLRDSARDLVDQLYSMTSTPPSVREYADFIAGFATEAANSALNDFQRQMVGIEAQMRANIARANDLARAAGLQGARERDLALIHQQAAAAAAVAMAQLRASGRSIVAQLYGDANAGAQQLTQPFTQAAAAASGSLSRITDELRQFADGLRLGDLSPLNQREQLAEAMRQLREASGAGDQQRVQQIARETLQIGRGLFATGSDYRELFNQVDAIVRATVPSATGGTGGGGGPVAEAARQVSAIERAQLAQQLAQITADSAAASGETFAQVAEDLGFTLEQLARDLGLDQDALGAYLESLQVDTASVAEEVTSAADRIVAAIREQAVAGLTNNAERARIATELAQITADLAQASGDSFAEVADALGFNLEQLARDLGLDQAALEAYLESLQIDAMSVADEIATAADRIVAAIREAATATPANPAAPGAPPGATPVAPTTPATPGPPPGATPLNPNSGGTPGEPIPVQPVEPPGGGIVGGELRRLGDLVERLLVERRNDQAATIALQGRVEQLTAQMADALAEVADGGGRIR